jgi:hypothetical protein
MGRIIGWTIIIHPSWTQYKLHTRKASNFAVAYLGSFFGGVGVQQIQLRTEGRENGDLKAVAPIQGFHSICKLAKPVL